MLPQEEIVVAAIGVRDPGKLDSPWANPGPQPSAESVHAAALTLSPGPVLLGGGEPTLRADLPSLIGQFKRPVTVITDGLALNKVDAVKRLRDEGLSGVRIGIHSARADAHDWLVGIPGAHRRIRKSVETLQGAGVEVTAALTLTRPAMPYLEETIALFLRMGLTGVHIRMIERRGGAYGDYVSLSPRLGLLQPALEAGLRLGLRGRLRVSVTGVPHCTIPEFSEVMQPPPEWICPDGISPPSETVTHPGACPDCPPSCEGLSRDYADIFGWSEVISQHAMRPGPLMPSPPPESGDQVCEPPGRRGRQPATRVLRAITQSELANLGGDPMAGRAPGPALARVLINFPATEDTRSIRRRMVQASQEGAETLLILGPMDHPEALPLLREALRLSFQQVILCGDITGLGGQPPNQLLHLRGLTAAWVLDTPENQDVSAQVVGASGITVTHFHLITNTETLGSHLCVDSPAQDRFVFASQVGHGQATEVLAQHKEHPNFGPLSEALARPRNSLYGPPGTPIADINWPQPGLIEVD